MSKKQPVISIADPTLPTANVQLGGKTFTLSFDLAAIAAAELRFRAEGRDVALLRELQELDLLSTVVTLFACSLQRFHPEVSYEDAAKLLGPHNIFNVRGLLVQLWLDSMPRLAEDEAEKNPPEPVQ